MRRDPAYLLDMVHAARDAIEFASGLTSQQFEQSPLHRDAALKPLEVMGRSH